MRPNEQYLSKIEGQLKDFRPPGATALTSLFMRDQVLFRRLASLKLSAAEQRAFPKVDAASRLARGISKRLKPISPIWTELQTLRTNVPRKLEGAIEGLRARFRPEDVPASKIHQVQGKSVPIRTFERRIKDVNDAAFMKSKSKGRSAKLKRD